MMSGGKYILRCFLIVVVLMTASVAHAQTVTTTGSGSWSSTVANAPWPGGTIPASTDNIIIGDGFTLTVDGNRTCNSIAITTGNSGTRTGILAVNSGVTLTVTTAVMVPDGNKANGTFTIQDGTGAGSLTCASLNVCNNGTIPSGNPTNSFTLTSKISNLSISGNLTLYGNSNASGNKLNNPIFDLQSGTVTVGGTVTTVNMTSTGPTPTSTLTTANGAASGTLVLSGATPFNLSAIGTNTITFTGASATVNYSGAAQTVHPVAYTNLTLSGSGVKTTTSVTVNGILSREGTATVSAALTYGAGATLQYKSSAAQTAGVEFPATFGGTGGLIINNSNGVSLGGSVTVSNGLTLTSGILTTGSSNTLTVNGTVTHTSGHVYGNLQLPVAIGAPTKTFDIGDATNYAPVTVAFASVTGAGNLKASTTSGQHPNIATSGINSSKDINRYWTLTNTGIAFTNYSATFTFVPGDILGGASTSNFVVRKYNAGWTTTTIGTKTSTSTQATGLTSFSDFAVGEQQIDHFVFVLATPQSDGVAFAGTNTLTAQDIFNNTITTFDASADNVTIAANSPLTGSISGLPGTNKLTGSGDFSSGVADLTSLGMKYTGNTGSGTFSATSSTGKTGTSGSVTISIGGLDHFAFVLATPQTNGVAFTGTNTLTAQDIGNNTITTFNASTDNVTIAPNSPLTGSISGLSGTNKLTGAGDFSSGVANLTSLGMKYTGNTGSGTFTATSSTAKTGTSGSVTVNVGALDHFAFTLATPQTNGAAFTGTNTVTAQDISNNTITAFDASANNVTITATPSDGTITGLGSGNNNVLNQAADFTSGVANLTSRMVFAGTTGSHTFTATSATSKTGTSGSVTINVATYTWNQTGTASWATATNWTPSRTAPAASDILQFNGGGTVTVTNVPAQTIGQMNLSNNSTVNLQAATAGNTLTVNDALTTTAGDVLNLGSGVVLGGTLTTLTNNGKIQTAVPTSTSATPIPSGKTWGGTVEYNGAAAQTAVAGTYSTLKANNSSGVSLGGVATVGTLTIGDVTSNSIFSDAGNQITSAGTLNLTSGTLNLGSGATATTYPGFAANNIGATTTVNYASSGAQTIAAVNYGNLTNTGNGDRTLASSGTIGIAGSFTTGSGSYTVTNSTVSFNGSGAQSIPALTYNNLQTSTSGTKTLGGTVTVNTALTVGGSTTLDLSSQTLNLAGSGTPLVVTGTLTPSTSTVNYTNAGATNIAAANYYNLNGTGGNRTLPNGGTVGVANTLTPGAGTYTVTGSTVSFSGSGAQSIPAMTYDNVQTATGGTKTLGGTVTVNSVLTVGGSTTLDLSSQTLNLAGSGTPLVVTGTLTPSTSTVNYTNAGATTIAAANYNNLNGTGGNRTLAGSGTIGIANTFTPGAGSYTTTGSTVDFNGSGAQSIPAINYNNLTSSSTGSRTLASSGTIGIAGTFTPGSNAYTITGSTIDFNGAAQTIPAFNGSTGYNNLTLSNSGPKTSPSGTTTTTVAGNLTLAAGVTYEAAASAAATLTLNGTSNSISGTLGSASHPFTTINVGGGTSVNASGSVNSGAIAISAATTLTNNGTATISGNLTGVASSAWTNAANSTLNVGGSLLTTGTLTATAAGNTVNYNGTGSQAVKSTPYANLTISGARTINTVILPAGSVSVSESFNPTATFTSGSYDVTANTINYNGTGAQTVAAFNYNNLTISGTRTTNNVTLASGTIGVAGTFTSSATFTSGVFITTGNLFDYNGTGAQTITLFDYNDLTISGVRTGNVTLANSGAIGVTGTFSPTATFSSGGYVNSGSTINFQGAGSQTIPAFNYNNLTSSSTGARTLASSGTIGIAGTYNPGSNSYTVTGSTVDFNSTGSQTIPVGSYNNLSVSGSRTTNNVTLDVGTINVAGAFSNSATFSSGTVITTDNTVVFNGSSAQSITGSQATPFNILTVNNAAGVTNVANGTTVNGTLTLANGTFTLTGGFTMGNGAAIVRSSGSLTGVPTFGASVDVTYTNGGPMSTGSELPSSTSALRNLTINGAGITLSANAQVNNVLTFTLGNISTGANTITIGPSASVSRASGYVIGNLAKNVSGTSSNPTFEVGDATTYAPVTATFTGVSVAGTLTARTTAGDHPDIDNSYVDKFHSVNRYWTLSNSGITFTSCDAVFNFVAGDLDAGTLTSTLIAGEYAGSSWSSPTVGTKTATSTQLTGLTAATISGDYQLGRMAGGIYKSTGSGNWNTAGTWDQLGVPGSNAIVIIMGGHTVTIDGNTANIRSVEIQSGATLQGGGAYTISFGQNSGPDFTNDGVYNANNVTTKLAKNSEWKGSGQFNLNVLDLNLKTLTLNAGMATVHLSGSGNSIINGGSLAAGTNSTIDFNGTGAQTIPPFTYNNLSISGTRTTNNVTLVNGGVIGITGSFTNSASFTSGGFITTGNLISYSGTGAQTITAFNYNDLTISGPRGGATITLANAGTIGIAGIFDPSATSVSYSLTGSTVDYNSASDQGVIGGASFPAYNNLTISGAGTKVLSSDVTINNNLVVRSGNTLSDAGYQIIGNGSGTMTMESGATLLVGTALTASQFPTNFTSGNISLHPSSTVTYKAGQPQTISAVPTYGNILINGAGAKSLGGGSLSVAGNWTNNSGGSVDASGSTVTLSGASQIINGSVKTTFNNLTIGGTAGKTANANVDVSGALSVNQTLTMGSSKVLTMLNGASQPIFTSLAEINGTMTWQAYNASAYKFNNDQTVITFSGADGTRTFTVTPSPNTYPSFGATLAGHTVKRVYTLNYSGWNTGTASLQLGYLQSEASTLGVTESRLRLFQTDIALGNSLNGVPARSTSGPAVFGSVVHSGLTSATLAAGVVGMDDRFGLFKSVANAAWNVASTWDQNDVPSTWDYVIVDNNKPVTIPDAFTADALSVTINATSTGLTVGAGTSGALNIGTGGLTNNNAGTGLTVSPNATVTITSGTLTNGGSITNNGLVIVQ